MDYAKESLRQHEAWGGKIEVISKVPCASREDLSLAYTPGVAAPCLEIQKDPMNAVHNAVVLEELAFMAVQQSVWAFSCSWQSQWFQTATTLPKIV